MTHSALPHCSMLVGKEADVDARSSKILGFELDQRVQSKIEIIGFF